MGLISSDIGNLDCEGHNGGLHGPYNKPTIAYMGCSDLDGPYKLNIVTWAVEDVVGLKGSQRNTWVLQICIWTRLALKGHKLSTWASY